MNLKNLLSENEIIYSLKSTTKENLFKEMLQILVKSGKVNDEKTALHCILEREKKLSTGMESGLAVPHAKTDAVNELVVAFGLHHEGLEYNSLDSRAAHFIFMVLSPLDTSGPHIKALASIARCIKRPNVQEALLKSKSQKEILNILIQD